MKYEWDKLEEIYCAGCRDIVRNVNQKIPMTCKMCNTKWYV